MKKLGYDAYTLNTLRRYVQAFGEDISLEVKVRYPRSQEVTTPAPFSR